MNKCAICGKPLTLPYRCKSCQKIFCVDHRLPEEHNCEKIKEVRKTVLPKPKRKPQPLITEKIPEASGPISEFLVKRGKKSHGGGIRVIGKKEKTLAELNAREVEIFQILENRGITPFDLKVNDPLAQELFEISKAKLLKILENYPEKYEELGKIERKFSKDPQKAYQETMAAYNRIFRDIENKESHTQLPKLWKGEKQIKKLKFWVKAYNNDQWFHRDTYIYLNEYGFKAIYFLKPGQTMEESIEIDPQLLKFEDENKLKAIISTYDRYGPKSWVSVILEFQIDERTEKIQLLSQVSSTHDRPPEVKFRINNKYKVEILETNIKKSDDFYYT